jgi:chemotaxis protein CheD
VNILVSISDMKVSNNIKAILVAHSLGSCIGIAMYDPLIQTGGILHFMFPSSRLAPGKARENPYMFADTAIENFLEALYKLGAKKDRLKVVVAGGAEIIGQTDFLNIGKRNCIETKALLAQNNLKADYEDIGKNVNRTLRLELKDGKVHIVIPGQEEKNICMK